MAHQERTPTGIAPGGHAQMSVYLAGPLGIPIWGSADWLGQSTLVHGAVGTIVARPMVHSWRHQ
jgi:hypothetical protein